MKILIVSPNFPPDNTPDLHRIRMMLPYLVKQGHQVVVLAVDPHYTEAPGDKELLKTVPQEVRVVRTKAFDYRITRKFGLGNLGLRSFLFLLTEGNRIIRNFRPDIVFFSTTVFLVMPLGRIWKRKFNLPYILDFQDPWRNDYYLGLPPDKRPPKYRFVHVLNTFFEKWTLKKADGVVAVNKTYIDMLAGRYPALKARTVVLPMGAPMADFEFVKNNEVDLPVDLPDSTINAVYTGVVPDNMLYAIEVILRTVKQYNSHSHRKIKLFFIGTDYAPEGMRRHRVLPLARSLDMEGFVFEMPTRVGYLQSVKLMQEADLLLLPGTTDKGYTPSKFFVYLLSGKPVLAVFHRQSPLTGFVKQLSNLPYVLFSDNEDKQELAAVAARTLDTLLNDFELEVRWKQLEQYTDRGITDRFVRFAQEIISQTSATGG